MGIIIKKTSGILACQYEVRKEKRKNYPVQLRFQGAW